MNVVVLAYHEMGHRGLSVLLREGVEVSAVFTHEDDPREERWFGSVAALAREAGIPTFTPLDINTPDWEVTIRELSPDALLSFYYRRMVKRGVRRIPRHGCFNLHGSLLPRYRGRCPVNWQLLHGERESGVTLHHMVARADAGDIVDQERVEVGPDDTALDLYQRLLPAAEQVLVRSLPSVLAGKAARRPQDEAQATVFGGRRPEDGRVDWSQSAGRIHDLVRAVAPPWPGAFCEGSQGRVAVFSTRLCPAPPEAAGLPVGGVWVDPQGGYRVRAGDGAFLQLEDITLPAGMTLRSGDVLR